MQLLSWVCFLFIWIQELDYTILILNPLPPPLLPQLLKSLFFSFGKAGHVDIIYFFTYFVVFMHLHHIRVYFPLAIVYHAICKKWVAQGALADLRHDSRLFAGHPSSSLQGKYVSLWVCEISMLFGSFSKKNQIFHGKLSPVRFPLHYKFEKLFELLSNKNIEISQTHILAKDSLSTY